MSVKISVVIPVYNAEDTILRCFDSIVSQEFDEYEIIAVDDGSTDSSLEIMRVYASNNERVHVLTQKNQYAGVARNNGLAHAIGEYIIFMDADDYFLPNALNSMYAKIVESDSDLCICGGNEYLADKDLTAYYRGYMDSRRIPDVEPFNITTNPDYILNFTTVAPWNKLIKRSFIEKHDLRFQNLKTGNDLFFCGQALCLADKIVTLETPLVCHVRNQSASLSAQLGNTYSNPLKAWTDLRSALIEKNCFPAQSFDNRVSAMLAYVSGHVATRVDMEGFISTLREEATQGLGLSLHEPDYYYIPWHHDFMEHLLNDSALDFASYSSFMNYTLRTIKDAEKKSEAQKKNNFKAKYKKSTDKVSSLEEKIANLKKSNNSLKSLNDSLKTKNQSLKESNAELKQKNQVIASKYDALKNSLTFKVGYVILFIPRKIYKLLFHR